MQCQNCTNKWVEGDVTFPRCTTSPCWLDEYRRRWLKEDGEKHSFRKAETPAVNMNLTVHHAAVERSIWFFCERYDENTKEYNLKGSLSACTTVQLRDGEKRVFKTTDLMHSEMLAIDKMIEERHWHLYCGRVVWIDGREIEPHQFTTVEPHCGFCTFFLSVLDLPLTNPTYGLSKLASRLSYKLPVELETNVHFLARVLDSGRFVGFEKIKRILNGFVPLKSSEWVLKINSVLIDDNGYASEKPELHQISFDVLLEGNREVLYQIWKYIFGVLFQHLSCIKEEDKKSKRKQRVTPYTTQRHK